MVNNFYLKKTQCDKSEYTWGGMVPPNYHLFLIYFYIPCKYHILAVLYEVFKNERESME